MTSRFLIIILVITFNLHVSYSWAQATERLDMSTHDLMIQKLEGALSEVKGQPAEGRVRFRIADLYADRARLKSLEQEQESDVAVKADRAKAIGYYRSALNLVLADEQAKALLQVAHLYSLNGEVKKSREIFLDILKKNETYNRNSRSTRKYGKRKYNKKYSKEVLQTVYMGLGEQYYLSGEFDKAEKYFSLAQKGGFKSHALYYRMSWCLLNRGDTKGAKKYMLLVLKSEGDKSTISLKKDVARDLAMVISREEVNADKINDFLKYSDEGARIDNLFYLGEECDRLDNRDCSRLVWSQLLRMPGLSHERQLEIELRQAQNYLNVNNVNLALAHYQAFNKIILSKGCDYTDAEACKELQVRSRSLVYNWIKKEKAKPSQHLLEALASYIKTQPTDFEMSLWAGHIARELKQIDRAIEYYRSAADESARDLDKRVTSRSQKDEHIQLKTMVGALLLEIECAESTSSNGKMKAAYEHYLQLNPKGRETQKVKAQHAHIMRQEAVSVAIEKYAGGKGSKSDLEVAIERLKSAPMLGATSDEKIKIYRNQIQIAEVLKDLPTVDQAAVQILKIRPLAADDREFALGRRLWVAETHLDFKLARSIAGAMKLQELRAEDRLLKLAILTELSGVDSKTAYRKYLKLSTNKHQANIVRGKIIREASRPWVELKRHHTEMMKTPSLFAEVVFEVFAKNPNMRELGGYLKYRSVRQSVYGKIFLRFNDLENDKSFDKKLRAHRIFSHNETVMQKRIRERIAKLKYANKMVTEAQGKKDFTLQIAALNRVARENQRLHDELLRLPVPRGLKKNHVTLYQTSIKQRAEEFRAVAANVNKKIAELFARSRQLKSLIATSEQDYGARKKIALYELQILASFAPEPQAIEIASAIERARESNTTNGLNSARNEVRQDPFDVKRIERLRSLEMERGSSTMVAYLDARIEEIKRGKL